MSDFTTIPPYYNYIKRPSSNHPEMTRKSPARASSDPLIRCITIQFHIHITVILAVKMFKMLYSYFMFK